MSEYLRLKGIIEQTFKMEFVSDDQRKAVFANIADQVGSDKNDDYIGDGSITDLQKQYINDQINGIKEKDRNNDMEMRGEFAEWKGDLEQRRIYFDDGEYDGRQPNKKESVEIAKTMMDKREQYYKNLKVNKFSKQNASKFIEEYKRLGRNKLFLDNSGIKDNKSFVNVYNKWAGKSVFNLVGPGFVSMND